MHGVKSPSGSAGKLALWALDGPEWLAAPLVAVALLAPASTLSGRPCRTLCCSTAQR